MSTNESMKRRKILFILQLDEVFLFSHLNLWIFLLFFESFYNILCIQQFSTAKPSTLWKNHNKGTEKYHKNIINTYFFLFFCSFVHKWNNLLQKRFWIFLCNYMKICWNSGDVKAAGYWLLLLDGLKVETMLAWVVDGEREEKTI